MSDRALDEIFNDELTGDERIARARRLAKVLDEENIRIKLDLKVTHYIPIVAALVVARDSKDMTTESKREIVATMNELERQLRWNFPGRAQ